MVVFGQEDKISLRIGWMEEKMLNKQTSKFGLRDEQKRDGNEKERNTY